MCPHYFVRIINKPPTFNPLWTVEDLWAGFGISIQRWLYQYISCYSKTISSSNTLNIDQGLFYHNTLVSRTTSHVKNGNGVKSVTIEDEIHSMKNLFLGGLARCRRWCGYSIHSGFNSENRNFQVNFKLYLFINTIKYFKHMVNWNIELRNCHPYTPIYRFSLIDNAWMHSLHMEFLEKYLVFAKLTYLLISWSGWSSLQIEVVQRKFAGTVSSWGSLSVKHFSTKV